MLSIYGIGTDIVSVPRIEQNLADNKDKFISRILSQDEILNLPKDPQLAGYLAKRFAGKEAFAKALGTGIAKGISFNQISILNDAQGQPYIICTGQAQTLLEDKNIKSIKISLSDEKEYAIAFVVLESITSS